MKKNGFRIFIISTICSIGVFFGLLDVSLASNYVLEKVETTSTTTASVSTNGNEFIIVRAKGSIKSTGSAQQTGTVSLNYDGTQKDIVNIANYDAGSVYYTFPFYLSYSATPASSTKNITVTSTKSPLTNVVITVEFYVAEQTPSSSLDEDEVIDILNEQMASTTDILTVFTHNFSFALGILFFLISFYIIIKTLKK